MLLTRSALVTPFARSAAPSARCQTARCCRPAALCSAFTPARSSISSLTSGFTGLTLQSAQRAPVRGRVTFLVQAKNHGTMGCTLQGTRRRRTRTSGFRTRRLTVGGRKVIKNRRKRGRHTICPASNYKK